MTDSRMTRSLIGALLLFCLSYGDDAYAQYRNNSLTLDAGAGFTFAEGSLTDEDMVQTDPEKRGNPIKWQGNLSVAYNQKLGHDRWWISLGFGMGFLGTGSSGAAAAFGDRAQEQIGNTIGLETSMGVRYYLATDRVRPYIQPGMSYTRLFYLVGDVDETCSNIEDCPNGESNAVAYMPHPNIGSLQGRFGLEWIVDRNFALHLFTESVLWLLPNTSDPLTQRGGVGFTAFY